MKGRHCDFDKLNHRILRKNTTAMFSKKINRTIENIDKLFDAVDRAQLVFKEGVKNYLYGEMPQLSDNLQTMTQIKSDAEILRREIESDLYRQSAFVRLRGDVMRLLERIDNIITKIDNNLCQFEIERPYIPAELNSDYLKLAELSTKSVESAIPAAKSYFRSPDLTVEKSHRVYFYAQEADKQAKTLKRTVFHNMNELKLSEKFHLRYFALHIEELSHAAIKVADQLSVMAIKRSN